MLQSLFNVQVKLLIQLPTFATRYADYGRHQSAPVTPTPPHGLIKEESTEEVRKASADGGLNHSDSDSEYGFDSQWTPR